MLPAMCLDTGMLIAALFWVVILGVACCAPFVFALIVFARWAGARRKRLAAEA